MAAADSAFVVRPRPKDMLEWPHAPCTHCVESDSFADSYSCRIESRHRPSTLNSAGSPRQLASQCPTSP
eukprot:1329982-Pleurochrysis_carterae.AAC.1